MIVSKSVLRWLAHRNTEFSGGFLGFALNALNQTEAICAELLTARLKDRLLSLLAMFDERVVGSESSQRFEIELPIQRKDLADLLGPTRLPCRARSPGFTKTAMSASMAAACSF